MRLVFGDLQQTLRDEPRLLVKNILLGFTVTQRKNKIKTIA